MSKPSIPEILETTLGESLEARQQSLASFKELGPPDLVHLAKINGGKVNPDSGTYHYVTGVEIDSAAAMAAYLNTLTYLLGEEQVWFGKHIRWKVNTGIYCCYNAFSRIDVRVEVKIPGSVEAYSISERGVKRQVTELQWLETYLCAVLRGYLYVDDDHRLLTGCRRFNPIEDLDSEAKFLSAVESLFSRGVQLGSDPDIQVPTIVSNYLVAGFLKYLQTSRCFQKGLDLLDRLEAKGLGVAPLKARVLLDMDEEVQAVKLMYDNIKQDPRDAALLDVQAGFCLNKGRSDFAFKSARKAVEAAPSEFGAWAELVEAYVGLGDYRQALLTLNSCPMFSVSEIDQVRMPQPQRQHLPLPENILEDVGHDVSTREQELVDPILLKLPALNLRGTFAKAYKLLAQIVSNIDWDILLKLRSSVFVMEEEYRSETAKRNGNTPKINGASVDTPKVDGVVAADETSGGGSAGSDPEKQQHKPSVHKPSLVVNADHVHQGNVSSSVKKNHEGGQDLKVTNNSNGAETTTTTTAAATTPSLKDKRLCERWLDNLFMVFYEDLRVYTIWQAEYMHCKSSGQEYKKSPIEWELLGLLARRLNFNDEAADAFNHTLSIRFAPRAMMGLIDYYDSILDKQLMSNRLLSDSTRSRLDNNPIDSSNPRLSNAGNSVAYETATSTPAQKIEKSCDELVIDILKMASWNHRWYNDFSPHIIQILGKIIQSQGITKVRSKIKALPYPEGATAVLDPYFEFLQTFKVEGYDM